MQQKQILLKLAEDLDAVIAELEQAQAEEKTASDRARYVSDIGTVGTTPASTTNPMLDFLFNQ